MSAKELVSIDSMQFMNYSSKNLFQILHEDRFKYLSPEFFGKQLELVKRKGICPYEYIKSFERFNKTKLSGKKDFYSMLKMSIVVIKIMSMLLQLRINLKWGIGRLS